MSNLAELLERESRSVDLEPGDFERLTRRRDRKRRNQRVAAGVLGVAVFALAAIGFVRLLGSEGTPASDPQSPFAGTWVSTDIDGGTQTMTVRVFADDSVEVTVRDDVASECSGTPSTMTGTGGIEAAGTQLVINARVHTCNDGSEPETLSGPPPQGQLNDWTLFLDPQTDTLSDGVGVWVREGEDPSLVDLEPVWPQTSFEELRQAQELADAGDPRYTWQIDRSLGQVSQIGQHHPGRAEIFARFLEEELGWEGFLWAEASAHPDGLGPGDVVYIRCAPGLTNPLYPTDPEGRGCAPTIDELRYETVKINVAQLVRQDARGIWVVTGWEMIEPFEQNAPPSDAELTAFLEAFLQARIDGEGAEGFADLARYDPFADVRVDREIPLLYATSTGVPYERAEFEIVQGPTWPEGSMRIKVRLSAEKGKTMVEQLFSLERDRSGSLRLVYDFAPYGSARPVLATTENGEAVLVEYGFLDGAVTYHAADQWEPGLDMWYHGPNWTTITGLLPDDDAPRRVLLLLADPRPIGPGCAEGRAPADAEALARSIGTDPDFDATAPEAVTIGGIPALRMDVVLRPGASACGWSLSGPSSSVSSTSPILLEHAPFDQLDRARLYLLDLPGGSQARVLALVTITDEDSFETVLEFAAPIVESIEFHAP